MMWRRQSTAEHMATTNPVDITVTRSGRRYTAQASLTLAADRALVWTTITDYAGLPGFMPGIRSCRVIERERTRRGVEELVVEQSGEFRFLWLRQRLDVRLAITHEHRRVARARALTIDLGMAGDRALDAFEGCYTISDADAGCVLGYEALMVSRYPPPPGIGSVAVRQNLREQLAAIAAEVARRTQSP
jgi:hypothetical protein